jgi:hypothetical protein
MGAVHACIYATIWLARVAAMHVSSEHYISKKYREIREKRKQKETNERVHCP